MKTNKQSKKKNDQTPLARKKSSKLRPAPSSTSADNQDTPAKPEERESDNRIIAPDGAPETKKESEPLF